MKKLKQYYETIKTTSYKALRIIIFISSSIALLMLLRYIGIKGVFGMIAGMTIMGVLLLSKNKYFKFIIDLTSSENYLNQIMKGDEDIETKNQKGN